MMTASAVSGAGGVGYYLASVGKGREAYYLDAVTAGEPAGRWFGKLAEDVGLAEGSEVTDQSMLELFLENRAPGGAELGAANREFAGAAAKVRAWMADHPDALPEELERTRFDFERSERASTHGWDVTANAPKSVSVAWASLLRAAQDAEASADRRNGPARAAAYRAQADRLDDHVYGAAVDAMRVIEQRIGTRAGWHGGANGTARYVPADGIAAALFRQHDNREQEMHLHVHGVIHAVLRDMEGQLRKIDGKDLLAQRLEFSTLFDVFLADRLTGDGYEVEYRAPEGVDAFGVKDPGAGAFELRAVPRSHVDAFSTRRAAISKRAKADAEAFEAKFGRKPSRPELADMHERANKVTRKAKSHKGMSAEERLDAWAARHKTKLNVTMIPLARRLAEQVSARRGPARSREFSPETVKAAALEAVADKKSRWTRADLVHQIKPYLAADGRLSPAERVAMIDRLAEEALAEAVQVAGLPLESREVEQAGRLLRESKAQYATKGTLAAEDALRQAAVERGGHHLDRRAVEAWLDEHAPTAGADQRAVLLGLATTDARLARLEGPAGTGKSYTMSKLSAMWAEMSQGGMVTGLAVSQRAANVLRNEGVERTANIHQWLQAQERIATGKATEQDRAAYRMAWKDIILIDEASMVSREQVLAIKQRVEAAGARWLMVQDSEQLGSVGAGGIPALLDGYAETYRLVDVRRFSEEWEKRASIRMREGELDVIREYSNRGRLYEATTPEQAREIVARAVAADLARGLTSFAVVRSNEEAALVADMVREQRVAAGQVEAEGVDLPSHGGGTAGVGDLVQMRSNDHANGVANRDLAVVRSTREDGALVVEKLNDQGAPTGVVVDLSPSYVAQHVSSGYAGTVHAVQGVTTTGGAWSILDGSEDRAAAYVAATRSKSYNGIVAVCPENERGERPSPAAVVAQALENDHRDVAALVAMEQDELRRADMGLVMERLEMVVQEGILERTYRHLERAYADGLVSEATLARFGSDKTMPHLARQIRGEELAGRAPEQVLRAALRGEFPKTGNVAQVAAYRIGQQHGVRQDLPAPGAARTPADLAPAFEARAKALDVKMDARCATLGAEAAQEPPEWAVRRFGPVPAADAPERAAWEERAGKVAGYREASRWDDAQRALPEAPSAYVTERHAAWVDAYDALGRPEEQRDEAHMTEGQLRARVAAWERELAWAPDATNEAAQALSQRAVRKGQEAVLAGEERARKEAQAEHEKAASLAATATRMMETREEFMERMAPTRDKAKAAAQALKDRDLPAVGEEPDRTTPQEWMGLEEQARAEDDAHRQVTEADVAPVDEHQVGGDHAKAWEAAEPSKPQIDFVPTLDGWNSATEQEQNEVADYLLAVGNEFADQQSQDETEWLSHTDEPAQDTGDPWEIGGVG